MSDSKKVTFFIVNNETGQTKKFVLSLAWMKTVGLTAIIVVLVFAAGILDYFGLLLQAVENKRLRVENELLIKQFQVVEGRVSTLENSLERVKSFTTKLQLITNIDDQDRITRLTIGAKPSPGQPVDEYEPMDQRMTNEELKKDDEYYAGEKPLNDVTGELAATPSGKDYGSLVIRIDKAVAETQLKEQSVISLWEGLSERQALLSATPNIRPARGWLTSGFGYRISPFTGRPALHAGLDIAASPGSPVFAPADGMVIFAAYDDTYGKLISVDHGYGVTTRFAHLSQIYVQLGQRISKWDVIGSVGNTGRSTGPHLHYEVRVNGTPVDPSNFILDE